MSEIKDKLKLIIQSKEISGVRLNISYMIVCSAEERYTQIEVETSDGKYNDKEIYHGILEIQEIDYLIDRMTIGVLKKLCENSIDTEKEPIRLCKEPRPTGDLLVG